MADTNFVDKQTVITQKWAQDVNNLVYRPATAPQFDNSLNYATTAFTKRQGIATAYQINISTNTTLTAAQHVGAYVLCTASSGITMTLPLTSTVAAGGCIMIQNAGTVAVTISRQGSDLIYVGSAGNTSLTIQPGDFVLVETDGFNWVASGTGVLYLSTSFGVSLAANGYQKLPSGLIMQWGQAVSSASATLNVTFNIPFTAAPYSIVASPLNSGASMITNYGATTSSVNFDNWNTSGTRMSGSFYWIALGK